MKYILRWLMLCTLLLMLYASSSYAEAEDNFHLVFSCESGTVISANASDEYGAVDIRIHVQYPFDRSPISSGEAIVKEIEINAEPQLFEEVAVDDYATGSRADHQFRVTGFSGQSIDAVSIVVVEKSVDGEQQYRLDLLKGKKEASHIPAIVQSSADGLVYDAPSSSNTPIGQLHDGTKLTVYFTTSDGWAAIGAGSRNAELWGYMRMQDLHVGEAGIRGLSSDIEQLHAENHFAVYGDAGCTHVVHEVQKGDYLNLLGCVDGISLIQTGAHYGYIPTEMVRKHSCPPSSLTSFIHKADVRRAVITTTIFPDHTEGCLLSAEIHYPPEYTVNDDIKSIALYINGDDRYILSEENLFTVPLSQAEEIATLVAVPIWASGGELMEDAVIIPLRDERIPDDGRLHPFVVPDDKKGSLPAQDPRPVNNQCKRN